MMPKYKTQSLGVFWNKIAHVILYFTLKNTQLRMTCTHYHP